MTKNFEEYLADIEKYGDTFPILKSETKDVKFKIIGPNKKHIELKKAIGLNYFSTTEQDIVYLEDITTNKKLTEDLMNKKFILHLSSNIMHIDFHTDYYYELYSFDTFEQFDYCQKYKKLTIALLNDNKSDIINKWTTDVNLL